MTPRPHPSHPSPWKLPARSAGIITPLLLSGLMTCIVSMVSTLRSIGWGDRFLRIWPSAWALSWLVAFPVMLLALPLVKRLTTFLVRAPS